MTLATQKVGEACEALLQHLSAPTVQAGTTGSLFGARKAQVSASAVDVEVTYLTAPHPHRVPLYALLPHEVHHGSVCLVTPNPQDKYKGELERHEDVPAAARVQKVIDVKKLSAQFSDPVACRALARAYNVFVVHTNVKKFPAQLTGEFLSHQHAPVWMPKAPTIAVGIEHSLRTAVIPRRGFVSSSVTVGHTALTAQALAENVAALFQALTLDGPAVLTLRLCATDSKGRRIALPIYAHDYLAVYPQLTSTKKA